MHLNGETDIYVMKTNSQGYPWGRTSWNLLSHLIFRGHLINFKFRYKRFNENCPATFQTTSRLSRRISLWNISTSWCDLQDKVRTDRTSWKKHRIVANMVVFTTEAKEEWRWDKTKTYIRESQKDQERRLNFARRHGSGTLWKWIPQTPHHNEPGNCSQPLLRFHPPHQQWQ